MVEKGERWRSWFSKWPNVDFSFVYFLGLALLLGIHKFLYFHWRYTYNSIESQIRVLGDYAFMLRDYELALSNYRLISTDYKLDKAWKRYAGVQVAPSLWCYNCFFSLYFKSHFLLYIANLNILLWWAALFWCLGFQIFYFFGLFNITTFVKELFVVWYNLHISSFCFENVFSASLCPFFASLNC